MILRNKLKVFYTTHASGPKAEPGAVVAIQTFGDFPLGFHPHPHILVSDPPESDFHENGMFSVSLAVDTKTLEQLFQHKVLKILLAQGKVTQDMITLLDKWRILDSMYSLGCVFYLGKKSPWKTLLEEPVRLGGSFGHLFPRRV